MKSMTGMGKSSGVIQNTPVRIEVKSVNHRFCEVHFRAHGKYNVLEILAQNLVKSMVKRGRVDIFIAEEKSVAISVAEQDAFKSYYDYLMNIKQTLNLQEDITLQHLLPGANSWIQKEMEPKDAWKDIQPLLIECLNDLNKMREAEGKSLKQNIKDRFENIENITSKVKKISGTVRDELQAKLEEKISARAEHIKEIDPQRMQTEILFYLDRLDIDEELERLSSHMKQTKDFLEAKEPIGRKVDFLLQEYNREFNTIASKSQNAEVAHLVVEAKSELEKIREQIQNIE